jgi:hypothetical protein
VDFSDALRAMKAGKRARRAVWAAGGLPPYLEQTWIALHDLPAPYGLILMAERGPGDEWWPFAGAHWDLLASDWEVEGSDGGSAGVDSAPDRDQR